MLALTLALSAFAGDTFVKSTVEVSVPMADVVPTVSTKLIVDAPITERWSGSFYSQVGKTYAEAYAGPSLHAGDFEINVSVGLESAEMPLRGASWVLWSHEKSTALACVEYGGTGFWYLGLVTTRFGPTSVGAVAQRYEGFGPRLGLHPKDFELYAAPLYDPEDRSFNTLAGISWMP